MRTKAENTELTIDEQTALIQKAADSQSCALEDLETMFLSDIDTFEVLLPHGPTLTFKAIVSHGATEQFGDARKRYGKQMMMGLKQKEFLDSQNLSAEDLLLYQEILNSRTPTDFEAAFVIHQLCLQPGYSELQAIRMTRMGKVVSSILEQVEASCLKATHMAYEQLVRKAKKD